MTDAESEHESESATVDKDESKKGQLKLKGNILKIFTYDDGYIKFVIQKLRIHMLPQSHRRFVKINQAVQIRKIQESFHLIRVANHKVHQRQSLNENEFRLHVQPVWKKGPRERVRPLHCADELYWELELGTAVFKTGIIVIRAERVPKVENEVDHHMSGKCKFICTFRKKFLLFRKEKRSELDGRSLRRRCRDFHEKGFCMRGDSCPYDHGPDPVVVEDSALEKMVRSGGTVFDPTSAYGVNPPPPGMESTTGSGKQLSNTGTVTEGKINKHELIYDRI